MVDTAQAVELYRKGYTLASIGRLYGVSRQRVWQKIKPHYTKLEAQRRVVHSGGKINPRKEERYIYNRLKRRGHNVEYQGYNSPFDLLVDGKKVQIKQRSNKVLLSRKRPYYYYMFRLLEERVHPDFYVFICGKITDKPFVCIVPSKKIKNDFTIGDSKVSLNARKYRERWDYFKN